jgi:hypothetical protein
LPAVQVSHLWQLVAPSIDPNFPTGHCVQEDASELPTALEKVPAAHLVHELSVFSVALNVPAGQSSHFWPCMSNLPAGHVRGV